MYNQWYNKNYPESDWNQESKEFDGKEILSGTPQEVAKKILELPDTYTGLTLALETIPYNYGNSEDSELFGYYYIPKTELEKEKWKEKIQKNRTTSLKGKCTRLMNKETLSNEERIRLKEMLIELGQDYINSLGITIGAILTE